MLQITFSIHSSYIVYHSSMKINKAYYLFIFKGMATIILVYIYSREPVIILPKDTLWPINYILYWPTNHKDSISLIMWMFIAKVVKSKFTTTKIISKR